MTPGGMMSSSSGFAPTAPVVAAVGVVAGFPATLLPGAGATAFGSTGVAMLAGGAALLGLAAGVPAAPRRGGGVGKAGKAGKAGGALVGPVRTARAGGVAASACVLTSVSG